MTIENQLFAIGLIVFPSIILYLAFWYTIKKFFSEDQKKREFSYRSDLSKETIQIRLQAAERLILLLERIKPSALALRVNAANQNVSQYQQQLLQAIRSEFDHNLTQQIYISAKSWGYISNAKESVIKLIHESTEELRPDAPALELARSIIEYYSMLEESPIDVAVSELKKEIKYWF
ncbi:hypothetical protein EMN47_00650 [Prolixibacteraceae bacterium JC049]|jgi:hypothetical protein|nr:hypothetical protein [Prolixibacteraceae bacterium JC049]